MRWSIFFRVFFPIALVLAVAYGAPVAGTPPARAAGTAWYVDNIATGANDGTSWANAWQSFADIQWSSIQPGDTLYISGGSSGKTYLGPLYVQANGAPGAPITIRVGQDPGHNGLVTITNPNDSATVPFGTGIYIGRNYITVDGHYGGMRRIRVTGCRDAGVHVYGAHHALLTYLEIDNNGDGEAAYADTGVYANIGAVSETPFLEVSYCSIHDNWQDQLAVSAARAPQYGRFIIHHNEIYNLSDDGLQSGPDATGIDFYNNVMYGMIDTKGTGHPDGLQILAGYGRIYNNVFYDLHHPTKDVNAYIYYEMHNSNIVQECCVRIYNNLIYHTQPPKDGDTLRGITFASEGGITAVSDALIANNTLVGLPYIGLIMVFTTDIGQEPDISDIYLVNNILHNLPRRTGGKAAMSFGSGSWTVGSYGDGADVTIDYNIISPGDEGGTFVNFKGNWWDYDTFKTNTGCQAHIVGTPDPLLNAAYKPTVGSPAIDAGVNLSAYFTTDNAGHTRPQGAGWDIGAYEFVPDLTLHGAPGDRAIHLNWEVNATLPPTSTWRVDYYTQTVSVYTVSEPLSTTRSTVLTDHVYNYQWYTVTLHAMVGSTPFLTDTVRVMPTDRFVYLPVVLR
ncbi:MAG: right-handed parallel beta-helix repeat-containing protein [Anaerolineae bacterium]